MVLKRKKQNYFGKFLSLNRIGMGLNTSGHISCLQHHLTVKTALCIFGSLKWAHLIKSEVVLNKSLFDAFWPTWFCLCSRMLACYEVLRVEKEILGHRGRAAPLARASAWITGWRLTSHVISQFYQKSVFFFKTPFKKYFLSFYFRRKWQNPVRTNTAAGPTPGPPGGSLPTPPFLGSCCWIKITATSPQVKR